MSKEKIKWYTFDNFPIGSEWRSNKDGKYTYMVIHKFKNNELIEVKGSDGVVRRMNVFKLQSDYYQVR